MFRTRRKSKLFRKKGPLKTRQVFFISFILFVLTSILSLSFVNKTVEPVIMNIAKNEINRIATEAIYESVEENIGKIDMEEFIKLDNTSNSAQINPKASIQFRTNIAKDIQDKLGIVQANPFYSTSKTDEQFKNVVYYIPLGVVTGNALLSNYGPKIPVKMAAIGHVESDLHTNVTHSGINNTLMELNVIFKVKMQIVIPSFSEETLVKQNINVGGILIKGEVPSYYSNGPNTVAPAIMKPENDKK